MVVILGSHHVHCILVLNIWVHPANQRSQADAARALLTVPDGDHLTLLNVYNQYMQSMSTWSHLLIYSFTCTVDKFDKNWTWSNYVSGRALAQAENVHAQLQQNMERFELGLISISGEKKMYQSIRQVLVCGFFMQVAHREGEKGSYLMVKDNQVVILHSSCGLDTQPKWVLFNEFVLTTRPYIHTVSKVRPEWYVSRPPCWYPSLKCVFRLLEFAPSYFDLLSLPNGETKHIASKAISTALEPSRFPTRIKPQHNISTPSAGWTSKTSTLSAYSARSILAEVSCTLSRFHSVSLIDVHAA